MSNNERVYIFKCSPEVGKLIETLAEHVEGGTEVLLQKSLVLMGVAMKAKKLKHKLVITDKDDKILDHIEII